MSSPSVPEACCLCYGQGNVQAALRPDCWLPFLRRWRRYTEEWHLAANLAVALPQVTQAALTALNRHGTVAQMNRTEQGRDDGFVQVLCFSRFRNLDVLELHFTTWTADDKLHTTDDKPKTADDKRRTADDKQNVTDKFQIADEKLQTTKQEKEIADVGPFHPLSLSKSCQKKSDKLKEITGGCRVRATSFRTGLLPVCLPLAPLWNVLLFWVPHGDGGSNKKHLSRLRDELHMDMALLKAGSANC